LYRIGPMRFDQQKGDRWCSRPPSGTMFVGRSSAPIGPKYLKKQRYSASRIAPVKIVDCFPACT
jgi:hypothetical protein